MVNTKVIPLLYPSKVIAKKHIISQCIHIQKDFQIYRLADQDLFVLYIREPKLNAKNEKKFKYSKINDEYYAYQIHDGKTSLTKIIRLSSDNFNLKGFAGIAGMEAIKESFRQDILLPMKNKQKYEAFDVRLPNGILFYGPPGCGKTFFANKIAEEIKYHFIKTTPSTFGSIYVHGTSLKIKEIFDEATQNSPSILFLDEIDALFPKRDEIHTAGNHHNEEINEFLTQFNDLGKKEVILIAATNKPWALDEAFLRTGRFDKKIYVGLPDMTARKDLFLFYLRNRPFDRRLNLNELVFLSQGFTNSDIEFICNEAAKHAIKNEKSSMDLEDFFVVINQFIPSVTEEMIKKYNEFNRLGVE